MCEQIETAEHLIFASDKFYDSRKTFIKLAQINSLNDLWNNKERQAILVEVVEFIKTNSIEFHLQIEH
jgi:hypothetical protein